MRSAGLMGGLMLLAAVLLPAVLGGVFVHEAGWAASGTGASALDAGAIEQRLRAQVRAWVMTGDIGRQDEGGAVKAVEVGQALIYAARARDVELYGMLLDFARRRLIQDDAGRPDARHMVLWRYQPGVAPDASGTTEALRLAEGLWEGYRVWGDQADRELALAVLRAYARHAAREHGVWIIRNYYNFQTRGFATNSFLVDYAPDFVDRVARETGDGALAELAANSRQAVLRARTAGGLFHDLIQPELVTLTPNRPDLAVFSPNDVVQLSNAVTVAEQIARGAPEAAGRTLALAWRERHDLRLYYFGRTGQPADDARAGAETWAGLVRLAAALEDRAAVRAFLPRLCAHARAFTDQPVEPRLYTAGEILLGLEAGQRALAPAGPASTPPSP